MKCKPLILLLDDDDHVARLCLRLLQGRESALVTAATIAQARCLAAALSFDLLLCDPGLPDGNGLDFVADFKTDNPEAPVIVMTGAPKAEDQTRAEALGVRCFLTKPFDQGGLRETVRVALRRRHE